MQGKKLTTAFGPVVQVTISPWEAAVMLNVIDCASLRDIANQLQTPVIEVARVLRDFHKAVEV